MTRKEAVERLQKIDFERSNARDRLAIHMAISALLPWKRLSEEKPPDEERIYFTYDPDWPARPDKFEKSWWLFQAWGEWGFYEKGITHWCELVGPEEE